jgi:hypothetical protein
LNSRVGVGKGKGKGKATLELCVRIYKNEDFRPIIVKTTPLSCMRKREVGKRLKERERLLCLFNFLMYIKITKRF